MEQTLIHSEKETRGANLTCSTQLAAGDFPGGFFFWRGVSRVQGDQDKLHILKGPIPVLALKDLICLGHTLKLTHLLMPPGARLT